MPVQPAFNYSASVERMARTLWLREHGQETLTRFMEQLPDHLAEAAFEVAENLQWPRYAGMAEDALVALMAAPKEVVQAIDFAREEGFEPAGVWQLALQAALYGDNVQRDEPGTDDPNPFADPA